jgi:hypothetical protein
VHFTAHISIWRQASEEVLLEHTVHQAIGEQRVERGPRTITALCGCRLPLGGAFGAGAMDETEWHTRDERLDETPTIGNMGNHLLT